MRGQTAWIVRPGVFSNLAVIPATSTPNRSPGHPMKFQKSKISQYDFGFVMQKEPLIIMLRTTFTTALKSRCLHTRSITAATSAALTPAPLRIYARPSSSIIKPRQRSFSSFSALRSQFRQAEQNNGLLLSDRAVKQLLFINERDKDPDQMLRILVDSGGCHGYQNKLDLTSKIEEDDIVFERDGARVVIDNVSLQFLKGSTVDFVEELIGSTFQVVANPNAKHTCGCNISYDIDLDMITQN